MSEGTLFEKAGVAFVPAEMRDLPKVLYRYKQSGLPTLLNIEDVKGVIHAHSTWSDGANTLEEMALFCKEQGFEYLGITDHSQAAFYANGLKPDGLARWLK